MLESSNNGEGGKGVCVMVCVSDGGVVFVGVEEAMDSGSDTMKESKLQGLSMVDQQ